MTRGLRHASRACLLAACMQANAQTGTTTEEPIDQIIVSGARSPIDISRIGSATTVITRADLERRQARYVTDVLRTVPGFAVSQTGVAGSQTQVRVRGSEANHVLVLIDGVRANDPATGDEFRWEYLATGNIERVEIVRGPQSALWGTDAVGAVVNIITTNSGSRQGGDFYAESGSNSSTNLGANGAFNIGAWALSAGVEHLDTDGENISRTGDEDDGSDLTTALLGARYDGGGRLSVNAGLRAVDANSQFDAVDFIATGLPADSNSETRSDEVIGNLGATLRSQNDQLTLHARIRYFDSDNRNFVDDVQDSSSASERWSYELQSDISMGDNMLVLALEHIDTDFRQRGAAVFGDPNQDQDMQITSAIGEYQHTAGDRLTWILSGRYDSNSDFDDIFTGKASLAYQWNDATRLRASAGTGQKTPTFTERFGFFPGQFAGNPELRPERSTSFEAGIDRDLLSGALSLQVTAFLQELRDEINGFVFDPDTFLATAENRPGASERSGIEVAAQWRLNDAFHLSASYTYTDASEEDDAGQSVVELRRPKHMGNITLDFASPGDRFGATLAADYGGTRFDNFFPPFPEPQQTVTLSNYWLVDLTARFRVTDSLTLFARGSNLLDEEYEQVFGYRTLGRTGYVGLRADFGR